MLCSGPPLTPDFQQKQWAAQPLVSPLFFCPLFYFSSQKDGAQFRINLKGTVRPPGQCPSAHTGHSPQPVRWRGVFSRSRSGHLSAVGQGLCAGLGVQEVEAHEHRCSFSRRHCTLVPKAQARAHCGAELAPLHGRCQLRASLDAQLFELDGEQRTAIRRRCGHTAAQAEDVVDPEGVTKACGPIEELLPAPAVVPCQLFVEAHADGGTFCRGERALVGDAQAHAHGGAEGVPHIRHLTLGVQANVHCLATKEGVPHRTDAHALAEAIVQPPELREHLVPVQVGGDVRLGNVRHGTCGQASNWVRIEVSEPELAKVASETSGQSDPRSMGLGQNYQALFWDGQTLNTTIVEPLIPLFFHSYPHGNNFEGGKNASASAKDLSTSRAPAGPRSFLGAPRPDLASTGFGNPWVRMDQIRSLERPKPIYIYIYILRYTNQIRDRFIQ